MKIREACAADLDRLVTIDAVAQQDAKRVEFIRHAVKRGQGLVCIDNDVIVGYGVLDYSFYAPGFVALLYVHILATVSTHSGERDPHSPPSSAGTCVLLGVLKLRQGWRVFP